MDFTHRKRRALTGKENRNVASFMNNRDNFSTLRRQPQTTKPKLNDTSTNGVPRLIEESGKTGRMRLYTLPALPRLYIYLDMYIHVCIPIRVPIIISLFFSVFFLSTVISNNIVPG